MSGFNFFPVLIASLFDDKAEIHSAREAAGDWLSQARTRQNRRYVIFFS